MKSWNNPEMKELGLKSTKGNTCPGCGVDLYGTMTIPEDSSSFPLAGLPGCKPQHKPECPIAPPGGPEIPTFS